MNDSTLRIYLEETTVTVLDTAECPDPAKYDPVLDDIRSVIMDLCRFVSAGKGVRFVVLGFGPEPWPTAVDPDLAVVLEQLPHVLAALRGGEPARLDFYEQGIERSLWFATDIDTASVTIACTNVDGVPHADRIVMQRSDVVSMLWQLGTSFLNLATRLCPRTVTHPSVSSWTASLGASP